MKRKILTMSVDFLDTIPEQEHEKFFKDIFSLNFGIIFYTHDRKRFSSYLKYQNLYPKNIRFFTRGETRLFIKNEDEKNRFLVIGSKDQDFILANNFKLVLLVPSWYKKLEQKALKYGLLINNLEQLTTFINTIYNQNYWYSSNKLDDSTYIFSLSDARSKYYSQSTEEKEIMEIFHDILKDGKLNFYEIFYYHFLSSISNNQALFNDINIWGIFPSSSGQLNKEMYNFKEQVRYFMNGKVPPQTNTIYWENTNNILIRHTPTTKSHYDKDYERIEYGATKHLNTIHLHPYYDLKKLRGKNVCIFDDYLTHGNSFECARNLLKAAGVNKIIFVTLGTFNKNYQYQNFELSGNIFSPNYNYKLIDKYIIDKKSFTINKKAKDEVENLHHIFNL